MFMFVSVFTGADVVASPDAGLVPRARMSCFAAQPRRRMSRKHVLKQPLHIPKAPLYE